MSTVNWKDELAKIFTFFRKYGIYASFGWATWKAFDGNRQFVKANERGLAQQEIIDALREAKQKNEASLRSVLYTVSNSSTTLNDIPLPIWYKVYESDKDNFKMVYINNEYEKRYNITAADYLGSEDEEVFDDEVAAIWERNDRRAYWSRKPIFANEKDTMGRFFPVLKWRVDRGNQTFIYGVELPSELSQEHYERFEED